MSRLQQPGNKRSEGTQTPETSREANREANVAEQLSKLSVNPDSNPNTAAANTANSTEAKERSSNSIEDVVRRNSIAQTVNPQEPKTAKVVDGVKVESKSGDSGSNPNNSEILKALQSINSVLGSLNLPKVGDLSKEELFLAYAATKEVGKEYTERVAKELKEAQLAEVANREKAEKEKLAKLYEDERRKNALA